MRIHASLAGLLLASAALAQSVLPPFDTTYQFANLGTVPNLGTYGGTAFLPSDPNIVLVAPYPQNVIRAIPLVRNTQGYITGFGAAVNVATVGGTDGGLAFGPTGVLFSTWYGPNRLSQIKPGSLATDRVDDLGPVGVGGSVGTCAFVPAGFPGAGRFKVVSWSASTFYDLPLTPDGNGTFAPGTAGPGIVVQGGPEGMVYMPQNAPLLGGKLLLAEWSPGNIAAYDIDANGDPIVSTRQVVAGGAFGFGGGAVDPVTGDVVFFGGSGQLLILRNGAACGTYTGYGNASPGALGTPTISGAGCARIGQTITIGTTGPQNGIGIIAAGYQLNLNYLNINVLQSLTATVISVLDATGQGSLSLPIPLNPALGNNHTYFQVAYLDASTSSGLISSAGLDILIR
ncbi:MAG: hypothetical protein JNK15_24015 [Planctomycetes bacterium]|nr:hypothetical protein [Planctomycetota bacterium]